MEFVRSDTTVRVAPGTTPDYNRNNPILRVLSLMEEAQLAAEREHYDPDHLQYLFPFTHLTFYGPNEPNQDLLDPRLQDMKTDFQKQNVSDFRVADTHLLRGWVTVGTQTVPFLRVSYQGGPDSTLSALTNHQLGPIIKLWIQVANTQTLEYLSVPYNPLSDRYEVELWGYVGDDVADHLDEKGLAALQRGEIQIRTDLVKGNWSDFQRGAIDDQYLKFVFPEHTMHPITPLHIALAWANEDATVWDSQNGANYHYEFNMILRGWDHYLSVGMSPNPHGGVGFLEYRNLMSNYGRYQGSNELGRTPAPWNFDIFGSKNHGGRHENSFAIEYIDLHLLKPNAGIGIHRHRDNQELFFMMSGRGYMIAGDWSKFPLRERCFEIRTLRSGHFAYLKTGQLHAIMNGTNEDCQLFMFGGYD